MTTSSCSTLVSLHPVVRFPKHYQRREHQSWPRSPSYFNAEFDSRYDWDSLNNSSHSTVTMVTDEVLDIRELAQIFDADNRDVYLSLYVDLSDKDHDKNIKRRMRAISAALTGRDQKQNLEESLEKALAAIDSLESKGRAAVVFIHLEDDFLFSNST